MYKDRTKKDNLLLVIKGLAMGAANKVPGVSGGIVAFVAGFYEEFIFSLQRVNRKALKLLLARRFKSFYEYINGQFISLIILGMLISYFSVSKLLDHLIEHYELLVWSVFFGMILGSIYSIGKNFKKWTWDVIRFTLIGIIIGLSISFMDPAKENDHLLFVFFCGIISVSGMTLPGFSGSFILILLGNYVLLLVDSVNALYDTIINIFQGDFSFTEDPNRIRMLKVLVVFTIGSLTGMVTFSHLINFLLKKFKNKTLSIILGFVIGSLGVVWPWKETLYLLEREKYPVVDSNGNPIIESYRRFIPELTNENLIAIAFIFIGIGSIFAIEWYGKKRQAT
ncbi:MAG: DUF368 domain-containing protein [Flavobacteriaceae bacterium]|nr:DUF368 domain-containing protein [Flavobacteriaceae bacterium]